MLVKQINRLKKEAPPPPPSRRAGEAAGGDRDCWPSERDLLEAPRRGRSARGALWSDWVAGPIYLIASFSRSVYCAACRGGGGDCGVEAPTPGTVVLAAHGSIADRSLRSWLARGVQYRLFDLGTWAFAGP